MALEGFDLSKLDLSNLDFSKLMNDDVVKKVSEKAETTEETTKSVLGGALPLLGNLFSGQNTNNDVTGTLAASTHEEPSLIQRILTALIPFILSLFGKKDDGKDDDENAGLLGGLGSSLTNLFTGRKAEVEEKAEDLKEAAGEKIEDLKEAVQEKVEGLKEAVEEKVEDVKEAAEEKAEDVKDAGKDEKQGVFGNILSNLGSLFGGKDKK